MGDLYFFSLLLRRLGCGSNSWIERCEDKALAERSNFVPLLILLRLVACRLLLNRQLHRHVPLVQGSDPAVQLQKQ